MGHVFRESEGYALVIEQLAIEAIAHWNSEFSH